MKSVDIKGLIEYLPGKTNRDRDEWLPLWVHLTDTAGVMRHLIREWLPQRTKDAVCKKFPEEELPAVGTFLALTHDVGKFTPVMAKKLLLAASGDVWSRLERCGFQDSMIDLYGPDERKSPHALAGETILLKYGCPKSLAVIVGAHHGKPQEMGDLVTSQMVAHPRNYYGDTEPDSPEGKTWEDIRDTWLAYSLSESGYQSTSELPEPGMSEQMILTGLLIMADWIASNTDYFPLISVTESGEDLLPEQRAEEGWRRLALPEPWRPSQFFMEREIFHDTFTFEPNQIQQTVIDIAENCLSPGLMILEAPMGVGKTEAALALAEIVATRTGCGGLYFGLPTQATANGIFPRLLNWANVQSQKDEAVHTIKLAHEMAELNEDYRGIFHGEAIIEDDGLEEGLMTHEWFRGRKQALLSEFVIGTIDQLLMAALKQKHVMLRHLGLAGKVVILDEVHSYDAYMSQYLDRALNWLGAYGTPVILLSATLPANRRKEMAEAYLGTKRVKGKEGWEKNRNYPLFTWTNGNEVDQIQLTTERSSYEVEIIRKNDEDVAECLQEVLQDGGCAGVIVNTVRRAQTFAEELRRKMPEKKVVLIHSGFVASDRADKERFILDHVGTSSKKEDRDGLIVVGTQVLEQSLDIDFDFMVTDLCPMDLLLQRIGRLQRHERMRPPTLSNPCCVVLGADGDLESGSEKVYGRWLLLRTGMLLPERIVLPDMISDLVQDTYEIKDKESLNDADLKESLEEYNKYLSEENSRANVFRLREPERPPRKKRKWTPKPKTIRGLLDTDVHDGGKNENEREARAQAAVRDTDPSIDVLIMMRTRDGEIRFLPWQYSGEAVAGDRPPSEEESLKISRQRLHLPRNLCYPNVIDQTIDELEEMNRTYLPEWQRSPMLRGELILLLDENLGAVIQGYHLRYDRRDGIFCEKAKEEGE